jgi:hypothetical protein
MPEDTTFGEVEGGAAWLNCDRLIKEEARRRFIFFISKIVKRFSVRSKAKHPIFLVGMMVFLVHCAQRQKVEDADSARTISSLPNEAVQSRYAFELCRNEKKNYLEADILRMPQEYTQDHTSEYRQFIPMKCIQFAQRQFHGSFARCEDEDSKPAATSQRPCMTESYSTLAYNAYHDVMDCFNLDPKEFYLQIMIESGFHVNAFNRTGFDSGIAQFTGNGIKRIANSDRIERTHRILLESSRRSCQRIASIVGSFDITSFVVAKRCAMISLPRNPYRGMLFNYLHTMLDEIDLRRELDQEISQNYGDMQSSFTDKIRRQLVYLAYNRGMTGMKRVLTGYIENRKKMGQVPTEADLDLDQNLARAKKILSLEPYKRDILQKSPIRKLTFAEYAVIYKVTYVSDMVSAQGLVRRYLGDECSRF